MKQALILALASFALAATAFAQASDTDISPGPHDPNPPMESPDLRLPSPCGPTPGLAAAGLPGKPAVTPQPAAPVHAAVPIDNPGASQCSANGMTQSAELPSLAPPLR